MLAERIEPAPMTEAKHRAAFFRQSGWMMIATVAGGAFMYAVHTAAARMPKDEYGIFTTLLQVISLMGIPAMGLQTIFAQQAAASLTHEDERKLAGAFRGLLRAVFLVWAGMAFLVFLMRKQVLGGLQISNPAALWTMVVIVLAALCLPIVSGMLQGRQNFLWLGWTAICNGVGRFVAVCVAVLVLGGYAAGALMGVLLGIVGAVGLGAWHNRHYWRVDPRPVDWAEWWGRAAPLTLGMGASLFMLSADMIFVQRFFPKTQTGYYAAAGMIGRALVYFTQAVAAVIFPKIVQSAARAEKTDVLKQALGVTALTCGVAAIGCTLFPSLPLRIVYDKSYLDIATPLVPWFAWCMLPLTLSTVLLNGLLARAQFRAVPWVVAVAAGYAVALDRVAPHQSFVAVIQTLGLFSSLLLGVCIWFTWGKTKVGEPGVQP